MPDTAPDRGTSTPQRDRLREALRPRLSRAQAVIGVLLALVGFLAMLQIRSEEAADEQLAGASREDLLTLLDSLDAASARVRAEIGDLQQRRRDLQSSADSREAAVTEARQQVETLGLLAGTLPATGPGVVIRIQDPEDAVATNTLLNAMEELRDAGAEAIEINDNVRVVAQSAFVDTPAGVEVDGQLVRPPYRVEAVGDTHTLREAVLFPGGLRDEVENLQGSVSVRGAQDLEIASLYSHDAPDFATPATGTDE
jgi:uncharacterized protein YlxW (UPF0749 family)